MNKYFKQYKWSNIFAMLRNQKKKPEICTTSFKGRFVIITGATSGIGYETACKYASMGADILTINRNLEKSESLCSFLKEKYDCQCSYLIADFSKLEDVHQVSCKLLELDRDIDVFIHNAGTYLNKKEYTEDGLEKVFQTNYLSTFILNYYLKDKFKKQQLGRIIFVNSEAHRFAPWGLHFDDLFWKKHKYSGLKSYGAAKMAQLLSVLKFNEYFEGTNVSINAMHPGNVKTNSGSNSKSKLYQFWKKNFVDKKARDIEISSEALYFLGASEKMDGISGKFFNLTTEEEPAPPALDMEAADQLWLMSIELGGLE